MKLSYSKYFSKKLSKKVSKNPVLRTKVTKQLLCLSQDINHSSLKMHKLKGERAKEYAIWIEDNLRITFILIGEEILLTDIITHDEY